MYSRNRNLLTGVFTVLREELGKAVEYFKYDLGQTKDETSRSFSEYTNVVKGTHGMTEEEIEKMEKKREAMRNIAAAEKERWKRIAEERQRYIKALPLKEQLRFKFKDLKEMAANATSQEAGAVALIQHCTRAHAAEVAVEQGIDVKSVNVVSQPAAVGSETKVVGYIDAPAASREEVMAYAEKLEKACPAAAMHGNMEWHKVGDDAPIHLAREEAGDPQVRESDEPSNDFHAFHSMRRKQPDQYHPLTPESSVPPSSTFSDGDESPNMFPSMKQGYKKNPILDSVDDFPKHPNADGQDSKKDAAAKLAGFFNK